jgi:hypothetical protein
MAEAKVVERQRAVERFRNGESVTAICRSLKRSREWFYKWQARAQSGDPDWATERSRRPVQSPTRVAEPLAAQILAMRQSLAARGLFCGAQAIAWELAELGLQDLPSVRTIHRVLARAAACADVPRRAVSKGRPYPTLRADRPGVRHQTDFVGPCYLEGPVRFYSLHSVDLATGRCAVAPVVARTSQVTIDALWSIWHRLGVPQHQQVDNETVFYGSLAHPRGMGPLIRLCLAHGVEPWFIPPAEPWRNGVVEKFNDRWQQHGPLRYRLDNFAALEQASRAFEERHNGGHRYTKLGGKTPDVALAHSGVRLRFPPTTLAPRHPLPKPERGRYHLIRFIRSDRRLDVFGEGFRLPAVAVYAYVRATVNVARQRLEVYLDDQPIAEHRYRLR